MSGDGLRDADGPCVLQEAEKRIAAMEAELHDIYSEACSLMDLQEDEDYFAWAFIVKLTELDKKAPAMVEENLTLLGKILDLEDELLEVKESLDTAEKWQDKVSEIYPAVADHITKAMGEGIG